MTARLLEFVSRWLQRFLDATEPPHWDPPEDER